MQIFLFFFFSSRRRHTRCSRDWSSDVCSSDLAARKPFSLLGLPPSRLPPRLGVQEDDNGPDLVLGQEVFPHRHSGVPRGALLGQSRTTLGDPPEDETLAELGDRTVVGEREGGGAEALSEVPPAVEQVAVAGQAILVINPLAGAEVFLECAADAEGILESPELDALPPKCDLARRGRGGGAELNRGRHGRPGPPVGRGAEAGPGERAQAAPP